MLIIYKYFFFSSRRRHTRLQGDWSSDVCSSDLEDRDPHGAQARRGHEATTGEVTGWPTRARPVLRVQGRGLRLADARGWRAQIGRAACRERVKMGGSAVI